MTATVKLGDEAPSGRLLRVFLGERDRVGGVPAFRAVVEAARELGLAGATVLHGSIGFGADSIIHRPEPWRLSGDLPVVIEVVDDAERIDALIARLERLLEGGGLITVENVRVLRYQASR
jgi:PII-like signaling protein